MSCDVSEMTEGLENELRHSEATEAWRMSRDVGEGTERLENEL